MAVKIRLQRKGRKKRPYYHIVVADSRSKRDGKYIERIGSYNPLTSPATITLDQDKAFEWLNNGAKPTYTARAILKFKGVLYRKHLQRGVQKGSLTQDQADDLYREFMASKEEKVAARFERAAAERSEKSAALTSAPVQEVIEEEAPTVEEAEPAEAENVVEAPAEDAQEAPTVETSDETQGEISAEESENKEKTEGDKD
jgi:small subunit ribosomal protein S16